MAISNALVSVTREMYAAKLEATAQKVLVKAQVLEAASFASKGSRVERQAMMNDALDLRGYSRSLHESGIDATMPYRIAGKIQITPMADVVKDVQTNTAAVSGALRRANPLARAFDQLLNGH